MWLLMAGWTLVGLGGIGALAVGRDMEVVVEGGGVVGGGDDVRMDGLGGSRGF